MNAFRIVLRVLIPVAILVAGGLLMALLSRMKPEVQATPQEDPVPLVDVHDVRTEDVRLWVEAQGTVVPRTETHLVSEVAGRVLEVSPSLVNGGFFDEEELLVRIDPTDYQLVVAQAETEVARAARVLAQEEADALVAKRNWESHAGESPSPLVLREPQVAEARSALAAASAMLEKARRDVERCEIRAPYAGRVRTERVDVGQFVNRGEQLAMVYAVDWAEVRLPLADDDLAFVDLPLSYRGEDGPSGGPPVILRARFAGSEYKWQGRILRTEGELDPKNRMVVAVARVEDPYGRGELMHRPPLTVGMFVEARIEGRLARDLIRLPRHALRSADTVYVVDPPGVLRFRQVEVLRADAKEVLISSGLTSGETVVVSPLELAVDGAPVAVSQAPDEGE